MPKGKWTSSSQGYFKSVHCENRSIYLNPVCAIPRTPCPPRILAKDYPSVEFHIAESLGSGLIKYYIFKTGGLRTPRITTVIHTFGSLEDSALRGLPQQFTPRRSRGLRNRTNRVLSELSYFHNSQVLSKLRKCPHGNSVIARTEFK